MNSKKIKYGVIDIGTFGFLYYKGMMDELGMPVNDALFIAPTLIRATATATQDIGSWTEELQKKEIIGSTTIHEKEGLDSFMNKSAVFTSGFYAAALTGFSYGFGRFTGYVIK